MWRISDPQGNESLKVKYDIVHYLRGRLLDIGAGPHRVFPYATTLDNMDHAWRFGQQFKPDIIADASNLSMLATDSWDCVFSSHTLEHLNEPGKYLKEWFRVIKKGGYLCLYLPHKELYPNIGEPGSNEDHKSDFMPEDVIKLMEQVGCWDLVVNEKRDQDLGPGSHLNEYSFLQVYQKGGSGQKRSCDKPKPEKTACVVRYGGIGDMIQAASIIPALKQQGYHVTFNTTPAGHEILKHDPNIDAFILQDKDQVPNEDLTNHFEAMRRRFDKFINLSEAVEATLLAMPGRTVHWWTKEARHKVMNINYLELEHDIAQVEHKYAPHFFPTPEEREWAIRERSKMGGNLVICMSLSGSSVHKRWPWIDQIIARFLLTFPECRIVLLGDHASQVLEAGWENERRVLRRSGEWDIRKTLTFVCKQADLVIGPETGVLNAVGMEPVAKVCFLSHSTKENLTKHWINTVAIEPPPEIKCYPCHMLHFNWDNCFEEVLKNEDGTDDHKGVSICQYAITPDVAWQAILNVLNDTGVLERAPPCKQAEDISWNSILDRSQPLLKQVSG